MWKKKPSKIVAVVVPLSNRAELTSEEKISLAHLRHFLGSHDKYMVAPKTLQIAFDDFSIKRFDDAFFGSAAANGKLMLSSHFYEVFSDYKYILIYHLDALVFSDQLIQWCEANFDYIAPPWIKYDGAPYAGMNIEGKIGNGGFSLRNVENFLKILNKPKKILPTISRILKGHKEEISGYPYNEDTFWSLHATEYYPKFSHAPLNTALRFAFECNPKLCFEMNQNNLPFGCHAWHTYDRTFWEPYLLR